METKNPLPKTIVDDASGMEIPNNEYYIWDFGFKAGYKQGKQDGIEQAEFNFNFNIRPKLEEEAREAGVKEALRILVGKSELALDKGEDSGI